MATTQLTNLVNPKVMGDLLATKLPSAIKISPLANIDTSLVGQAGDTISIPAFKYIGDATEVAEGGEIDLSLLQASATDVKIKKVGKGAEITDEAVLSGYGEPVGELGNQLLYSIANGIDKECVTVLVAGATLSHTVGTAIDYEAVVDAVDKFGEEDNEEKYLIIHPKQLTALRKDANFIDKSKYGNDVMMTGEVGMVANCRVVVSNKVQESAGDYSSLIVKKGAFSIFLKRDVLVETDRDITRKVTVVTADEHFAVAVTDASKVVKLVTK